MGVRSGPAGGIIEGGRGLVRRNGGDPAPGLLYRGLSARLMVDFMVD